MSVAEIGYESENEAMGIDVMVVFEPFDDSENWRTYTGPLTENVKALMDDFMEKGTCTTYFGSGAVAYQLLPLSSAKEG